MRPQTRIDNPDSIDLTKIEDVLAMGHLVIIQFSSDDYSTKILKELNKLCERFSANFGIRFYGFYTKPFDCDVLQHITNVKSIWLDCLMDVKNIEELTKLKHLERLSLGVYNLIETEILASENFINLQELILGETKTTALNLNHLSNFRKLNYLIVSGHKKGIENIGLLKNLQFLGLNSISKISMDFINSLEKLKSLNIILGGRTDIKEIKDNKIESLEIVRVRGFSDLTNISNFKELRKLRIEDQIKLEDIAFTIENETIGEIIILNCKNLRTLNGLGNLKQLKYIKIYKTALNFDKFIDQPIPKSIENITFTTTKRKEDINISNRLKKLGYQTGP